MSQNDSLTVGDRWQSARAGWERRRERTRAAIQRRARIPAFGRKLTSYGQPEFFGMSANSDFQTLYRPDTPLLGVRLNRIPECALQDLEPVLDFLNLEISLVSLSEQAHNVRTYMLDVSVELRIPNRKNNCK